MFKRSSVLKEFGPEGFKVREKVAEKPSLWEHGPAAGWTPDIFCLRMDADEYTEDSFSAYYPLFEKHRQAITIFFNAYSFEDAKDEVLRCNGLGIDVQSHAFYHYTYNDYASNRFNIRKAREFFASLGIDTRGFAAPLGRWNVSLMKALEDEGYEYSSDFAYDYMGFPSYPMLGKRRSSVMQIPIFPVAPELFFHESNCDARAVCAYYMDAIDELARHGLPVIIYAHTAPSMPGVPSLLREVADYAVEKKGLRPVSMTQLFLMWGKGRKRPGGERARQEREAAPGMPGEDFLGKPVRGGIKEALKDFVKDMIDFERITPGHDLKCGTVKRAVKLFARRIL